MPNCMTSVSRLPNKKRELEFDEKHAILKKGEILNDNFLDEWKVQSASSQITWSWIDSLFFICFQRGVLLDPMKLLVSSLKGWNLCDICCIAVSFANSLNSLKCICFWNKMYMFSCISASFNTFYYLQIFEEI